MHEENVAENVDFGNSENRSGRIEIPNVSPAGFRNPLQSGPNSLYFLAMIRLTPTRNASRYSAETVVLRLCDSCACCMPIATGPAET